MTSHFIIFGERSDPPRNLRVPDFSDLGSRPPTSRPRNLPRARIKNSQRPPQNTRDKGNLIFHSYSKTDLRAPCASIYGPNTKRAGHKSKGKKRGSVTYSTDRENEVSKIFQISDAPRKQNESISNRF